MSASAASVKVYRAWLYKLAVTEWGCTKAQARHIAYASGRQGEAR